MVSSVLVSVPFFDLPRVGPCRHPASEKALQDVCCIPGVAVNILAGFSGFSSRRARSIMWDSCLCVPLFWAQRIPRQGDFVKDRTQFVPSLLNARFAPRHGHRLPFQGMIPSRPQPRLQRNTPGDAVQPAGSGSSLANGCRLANQNEESRLESVFRGMHVRQYPETDAEYHRSMPLHQVGKRRLLAASAETLQ
jgi:hypothetical protein